MTARTVAAIDLGAESGRVVTVSFGGERLQARVVKRFGHEPRMRDGLLRWDIPRLWTSMCDGLAELAAGTAPISSVGVDAWGVDYGLYGADGRLVDDPVSYRDQRTVAAMREALAIIGADRLYERTGVQLMAINTIFALFSDRRGPAERLGTARRLLMIPDIFHRALSGSMVSEYTVASTTGVYDMANGAWAFDVLQALGIPTDILPEVVPPGTELGRLVGVPAEGSLSQTRVILPPSHDTASAVLAVPFVDPGALFVSSGTWSLLGVEQPRAVITAESRRANLTNEGGYGGTIRLLRNTTGLWLLQQCRRQWAAEGTALEYQQIAQLAAREPGFATLIDTDAPEFAAPGDMPRRIREYCARHGLRVPQTIGQLARCLVDSLALAHRLVVEDITRVVGAPPPSISIVGGGANHELLAQLIADATGLPTYCGPVEATALGNGASQLVALGELSGPGEIRAAIAAGHPPVGYWPRPDGRWDEGVESLRGLIGRRSGERTADR